MTRESMIRMGAIPEVNANRSKFNLDCSVKTSFNVGDIIPLKVIEILPGDTIEASFAGITRMATPIFPVMDNLILDVYAFFTPDRLLWQHWPAFWGESDDPWAQTTQYQVPQIEAPSGGWALGTVADYMGIPTYVDDIQANALYFRAYAKIFSDWFRDENLQYVAHMYDDDTDRTGSNGTNYVTDIELGGMVAKACKTKDWYTGALPAPQKGPSVTVPIGTWAPVKSQATDHVQAGDNVNPTNYLPIGSNGQAYIPVNSGQPYPVINITGGVGAKLAYSQGSQPSYPNTSNLTPSNLYADLGNATSATISELRLAFQIQRYYEAQARGGSRYIEFLRNVFSVTSSDARLQRSEYLGGTRTPINMDQIIQTSATDAVTPQGNAAGFSVTITKDDLFTKSFEEHGILTFIAVARIDEHTYQQGLEKKFTRRSWVDYYNPYFSHLSEQNIENRNVYAQGDSVVDSDGNIIDRQTFGYQEAWSEYRYETNNCTGYMRSNAPSGSLDKIHYADDYSSLPYLGASWIQETGAEVDRTLAVSMSNAHQLYGDYRFKIRAVRVMPVYSYPGLIDHV